jgi:hypothetical protein
MNLKLLCRDYRPVRYLINTDIERMLPDRVIFQFFFLLRSDDRANRLGKISSMDPRFLLQDAMDFKIFQISNFLASRSRDQIARVVDTERHLFLGKQIVTPLPATHIKLSTAEPVESHRFSLLPSNLLLFHLLHAAPLPLLTPWLLKLTKSFTPPTSMPSVTPRVTEILIKFLTWSHRLCKHRCPSPCPASGPILTSSPHSHLAPPKRPSRRRQPRRCIGSRHGDRPERAPRCVGRLGCFEAVGHASSHGRGPKVAHHCYTISNFLNLFRFKFPKKSFEILKFIENKIKLIKI